MDIKQTIKLLQEIQALYGDTVPVMIRIDGFPDFAQIDRITTASQHQPPDPIVVLKGEYS